MERWRWEEKWQGELSFSNSNLRILIIFFPIIFMQRGQINQDIEGKQGASRAIFLLRRLGNEPHCPSVQVDFSPALLPASNDSPSGDNPTVHIHPTFNPDACYYTPAFILAVDKEKYVSNSSSYLCLHESKREELSTQKTDLFVPKPSKVSSFCCICRSAFDDYLTHVNIPKHQEALRKSQFSDSITQLCRLFNSNEVDTDVPKKGPKKQGRKIQKQQKVRKARKELDSSCCTSALKFDFCHQAKTRQTVV